ncbi:unnamed protein product [Clonostachys rosea]|uniref:Uncharacterized protein n=1 Tax=Bionectria ochroleuca TaxID=29856 RepID=A0ABY6U6C1_BIOOC|nr:unnamed protein product [Clonostachys rosea]
MPVLSGQALPFGAPSDVVRLFESARTDPNASRNTNNASLDPQGIASIANPLFGGDVSSVTTAIEAASPDYFHVYYKIDTGAVAQGNIGLDIQLFGSSGAAQDALKAQLSGINQTLSLAVKKAVKPLGQVSVQVADSLMWARDCLFIQVLNKTESQISAEAPSSSSAETTREFSTLPQYIQSFALNLDAYLSKNAVALGNQHKPDTTLAETSYTVPVGSVVSIKLTNDKDIHGLRPALSDDYTVAACIANGTSDGYPVRGYRVGKTSLTLIAAHAKTLAVGAAKVDIEVVDSQTGIDLPDLWIGKPVPV